MDELEDLRYPLAMGPILLTAILAALLSSAGTVLLAYVLFMRRYRKRLESDVQRRLLEVGDLLEARVKSGVIEGLHKADLDEQLAAVRSQVRAGVAEAAAGEEVRDLLEQWADEVEMRVRRGVTDAAANLAHPDVIRDATLNVTEVGTHLIAEGLTSLLGGAARKGPEDPQDARP